MRRGIQQILQVFQTDGIITVAGKISRRVALYRERSRYERWLKRYGSFTPEDVERAKLASIQFKRRPLISILMPVYNVDERWLRKAIESVKAQIYDNWELCIADDRSTRPHVRRVLEEYAASDRRIKVTFRSENGHISAASNSALELATGEFTALMDHDDELAPHALYFIAKELDSHPSTELIYTDEDKIDANGRHFDPSFKSDWAPDLIYSFNFVTHLIVYRTELLRRCAGFRVGFEGSQDYDLALRAIENIDPTSIRHIPRVLYHWRAIAGSVALTSDQKPYAHERARQAISEHFKRKGVKARSVRGVGELHRVIHDQADPAPRISVIIYGAGTSAPPALSLFRRISDISCEILVVAQSGDPQMKRDPGITHIEAGGLPKFSLLNNAAKMASHELLCFIDGSTFEASANWLNVMSGHAVQAWTGAVGARIVYPDKRIKHAGFILGIGNGVGRPLHDVSTLRPGRHPFLETARNYSAVSVDCLMIRKSVFVGIGGFDADAFPGSLADVDLCLRLLESGLYNAWTPWSEVVQERISLHHDEVELDKLRAKWPAYFANDPFYNPNLTIEREDLSLAFPPRIADGDDG